MFCNSMTHVKKEFLAPFKAVLHGMRHSCSKGVHRGKNGQSAVGRDARHGGPTGARSVLVKVGVKGDKRWLELKEGLRW